MYKYSYQLRHVKAVLPFLVSILSLPLQCSQTMNSLTLTSLKSTMMAGEHEYNRRVHHRLRHSPEP